MIRRLPGARVWVLETADTAYSLGVFAAEEEFVDGRQSGDGSDDDTALHDIVHMYWGPRLPRLQDYQQAVRLPTRSSFASTSPLFGLEYFPWRGKMYQEPSIKVNWPGDVRDVRLRFEGAEQSSTQLTLIFQDSRGLRVSLHYKIHEDSNMITRWAEAENTAGTSVSLDHFLSAAWTLPNFSAYRVTSVFGDWGREFQLQRAVLPVGKQVIQSRKGHTGHDFNPFFMVDDGSASERFGSVFFGMIQWSGNWKIAFEQQSNGRLVVSGGYNDFDFRYLLKPGDKLSSPKFTAGCTTEGFGEATRTLHAFGREVQKQSGTYDECAPVLYNSWEATAFHVTESGQRELARKAAGLGVELFVIDDGWFGSRDSDKSGLGDWWVNEDKFPNKLTSFITYVERLGMSFGLWVEPEMVSPDSELYRAHPDWVYHFPERPRTLGRHQLVLDLSRGDVRDYIFAQLDKLLKEYQIHYLKWDMNRPLTEAGSLSLPAEQQREVWIRHVNGLYKILHSLRQKYPRVTIESCSGGGGRVDLGMMEFASQFWVSDNTDAYDRLQIQQGFTMAYPPSTMRAWVTDSPQFINSREVPLMYRFHSAMMGALGIGADISRWDSAAADTASELVDLYKSIRHCVLTGDMYRLYSSSADAAPSVGFRHGGEWEAVEYAERDRQYSIVFVLGRGTQYGDPTPLLYPRGLRASTLYSLEVLSVHTADQNWLTQSLDRSVRSGTAWANIGFRLWLRGDYASAVIRFREIKTETAEGNVR